MIDNSSLQSSCLYLASMTIKTVYYPTDVQIYIKTYIGQAGKSITVKHKEHHYINNNPTSAYAMHILDNRHEYGSVEETKLLKSCRKGTKMNCWEALFMHIHKKQHIYIRTTGY